MIKRLFDLPCPGCLRAVLWRLCGEIGSNPVLSVVLRHGGYPYLVMGITGYNEHIFLPIWYNFHW